MMDTDLNITSVSRYRTNNASIHNRFKVVSDQKVISYDRIYLDRTSYYEVLEFDTEMTHQQSTLIDFNMGVSDLTVLPSGEMVWVRPSEEILLFDKIWEY